MFGGTRIKGILGDTKHRPEGRTSYSTRTHRLEIVPESSFEINERQICLEKRFTGLGEKNNTRTEPSVLADS